MNTPFALSWLAIALLTTQSPQAGIDTAKILSALELKPGQTVAEIGAGNGELTLAAARLVGGGGKVFTSELGDRTLARLEQAVKASGFSHITVVGGDPLQTNFPDNCCDAIFMRNVYHHFADPASMTASIAKALKPGGRVAVIDFTPNRGRPEAATPANRANDASHGVSPASVARELREAGLEIVVNEEGADRWFMVVAAKPR